MSAPSLRVWAPRCSIGASGLLTATLIAAALASSAQAADKLAPDARYELVHGCYALRSEAAGKLVVKTPSGYAATAPDAAGAEDFRMQTTGRGSYILYGRHRPHARHRGGEGARRRTGWQPHVGLTGRRR